MSQDPTVDGPKGGVAQEDTRRCLFRDYGILREQTIPVLQKLMLAREAYEGYRKQANEAGNRASDILVAMGYGRRHATAIVQDWERAAMERGMPKCSESTE